MTKLLENIYRAVNIGLVNEMKIVADDKLSPEDEDKLRDILIDRLGYPFTIAFTYFDEIPRGASGKFEDFKSEL